MIHTGDAISNSSHSGAIAPETEACEHRTVSRNYLPVALIQAFVLLINFDFTFREKSSLQCEIRDQFSSTLTFCCYQSRTIRALYKSPTERKMNNVLHEVWESNTR